MFIYIFVAFEIHNQVPQFYIRTISKFCLLTFFHIFTALIQSTGLSH